MALQINANTHTQYVPHSTHTHRQRNSHTGADKHAYGIPIEQLTLWAICFGHTLIWLWPAKSNAGAMKNQVKWEKGKGKRKMAKGCERIEKCAKIRRKPKHSAKANKMNECEAGRGARGTAKAQQDGQGWD